MPAHGAIAEALTLRGGVVDLAKRLKMPISYLYCCEIEAFPGMRDQSGSYSGVGESTLAASIREQLEP